MREQLPGDRLEVALLFLSDPVVVAVLAPARRVLVAVVALPAGAVGAEVRSSSVASIRRHLEEAGARPIDHHREQPAELVLDRGELPDERGPVHREPRAVHPGAAAPRRARSASQAKMRDPWVAGRSRRRPPGTSAIRLEVRAHRLASCAGRSRPSRGERLSAAFTRFLNLIRYLPRRRSRGSSLR